MKISLEMNDSKFEACLPCDHYDASIVKDYFTRLMVMAGYPPSVIDCGDGGGYQYVGEDEEIVVRESEQKAEKSKNDVL